jgi:hypothetical protein
VLGPLEHTRAEHDRFRAAVTRAASS